MSEQIYKKNFDEFLSTNEILNYDFNNIKSFNIREIQTIDFLKNEFSKGKIIDDLTKEDYEFNFRNLIYNIIEIQYIVEKIYDENKDKFFEKVSKFNLNEVNDNNTLSIYIKNYKDNKLNERDKEFFYTLIKMKMNCNKENIDQYLSNLDKTLLTDNIEGINKSATREQFNKFKNQILDEK